MRMIITALFFSHTLPFYNKECNILIDVVTLSYNKIIIRIEFSVSSLQYGSNVKL